MDFTFIDYADACVRRKVANCFAKRMHSKVLN